MARYGKRRRFRRKRHKRRGKKKYRVSTAKLRDRKINTLIEKRIQAISRREAQKIAPIDWCVTRGLWYDVNAIDPSTGQAFPPINVLRDAWPSVLQFQALAPQGFYYRQIAKVGGYLAEDWSSQMVQAGMDERSMHIHLKSIVQQFHFVNPNNYAVQVDIQLGRYAYDKQMLFLSQVSGTNAPTANPQPVFQDHKPFCTWNRMTRELLKYYKERNASTGDFNRKFSILARKRLTLPPSTLMDATLDTTVPANPPQGGSPDWAGLAQAQVNAASRVNKVRYHSCRLSKFWKGKGKRERYQILPVQSVPASNSNQGSLADGRYFFSIRVSAPCSFLSCSAVKFCSGKGLDRMVVFDVIANQAQ